MSTGVLAPNALGPEARKPARTTKRIAFIVSQFPETHETFILREFEALERDGLDFVIFSLKPCRDKVVQKGARRFLDRTYCPTAKLDARGAYTGLLRSVAATAKALPWSSAPFACAYISWAAARLAGLAGRLSVEHIHAHWATAPTSAAVIMSRLAGVPYSFTAHAWDIYAGDGRLAAKARGAAFVATCTGANARFIRSLVAPQDQSKVILNYHGVPQSPARKRDRGPHDVFRIAAVGRLVETKGFEYLLAAVDGLEFPYELTLVGGGPLGRRLEAIARRGNLAGKVRFAGVVPNEEVLTILAASDAFVMPSVISANGDRDGIPNVLLEAMSVGVPVVATDVSGIPEVVRDHETGLLVPERDAAAIRGALVQLRADGEAAGRLAAGGRALVAERFDAATNAHALFEVFQRMAGVAPS